MEYIIERRRHFLVNESGSYELFQNHSSVYRLGIWLEVKHRNAFVLLKREVASRMYFLSDSLLGIFCSTVVLILYYFLFVLSLHPYFFSVNHIGVLRNLYSMLVLFMEVQSGWLLEFGFAPIDSAFVGSVVSVYIKVVFQIYFLREPSFAVLTDMVLDLKVEGIDMSFQAIFGWEAFVATRHVAFVAQFFNPGLSLLWYLWFMLILLHFSIYGFFKRGGCGIFHYD